MDTVVIIDKIEFKQIKVFDFDLTKLTEDVLEEIGQLIDFYDCKEITGDEFAEEIKRIHEFICHQGQLSIVEEEQQEDNKETN